MTYACTRRRARSLLLLSLLPLLLPTLLPGSAAAQTPMEEVVYMKDGSIYRGMVIEFVPGESLLLQTWDGNRFRCAFPDILRITREARTSGGAGVPGPTLTAPITGGPTPSGPAVRARYGLKNPTLAWGLSFLVPGAGQFYNGQALKGMFHLGLGAGFAAALLAGKEDEEGNPDAAKIAGAFGVLGVWFWSQVDAPRAANAINERRVRLDVALTPDMSSGSDRWSREGSHRVDLGIRLTVPNF